MTEPNTFPGRTQKSIRAVKNRPSWAESSVGNAEAVQHWLCIGQVPSAEGHETLMVEIVQRDELSADDMSLLGERTPAEILVAGVRLRPADARQLAAFVALAADTIEHDCVEPQFDPVKD